MEPNKLETQFKEKLNSREIKPTEMAWDRLDAMLTFAEGDKPKRKFTWLYIAASFIGFLLVGSFYFTQKDNAIENQKNGVVIQNPVTPKTNVIPSKETDFKIEEIGSVGNVVQQSVSKSDKISVSEKDALTNKNNLNQNQAIVSINNQVKENDIIVNSSEKKSYESLSKNKYVSAEKLLAEVSNAKFEPKATDKINQKTKRHISVNPNRLLSDAETELNQSYRETALDRVNENFKAIKTVLVNRNYE
jgi:uncharacterized protein YfkK (UPF0435 family)